MGIFGSSNAPKPPAAPQLCVDPPVNPLLVDLPSVASLAEVASRKAVRKKRPSSTKRVGEDLAFNYAESSVARKVGDHVKRYDIWRTWRASKILQRNLLCLAQDDRVTEEQKLQLEQAFSAMDRLFASGLPSNRTLQEGVSAFDNADIQFAAYLYCFDLIRRSSNLLQAASLGESILSGVQGLFEQLSTGFLGLKLRQYFCHYLYVFGESNPRVGSVFDALAARSLAPKIKEHRELYNQYAGRFKDVLKNLPSVAVVAESPLLQAAPPGEVPSGEHQAPSLQPLAAGDLDDRFVDAPEISDDDRECLLSESATMPRIGAGEGSAASSPSSQSIDSAGSDVPRIPEKRDSVQVKNSSVNQAGYFSGWPKNSAVKHASRLADGLFHLDRAVKRLNQAGEAERFDCLQRIKEACGGVLKHHLNTTPITLVLRSSSMLNRKRARRKHVEHLLRDVERELKGYHSSSAPTA